MVVPSVRERARIQIPPFRCQNSAVIALCRESLAWAGGQDSQSRMKRAVSHQGTCMINSTWWPSCFLKRKVPSTCRVSVCWMSIWVWAQSWTACNHTGALNTVPSSLNCPQEVLCLSEEQMLNKWVESTPNYYLALSTKSLPFPGWPCVWVRYWPGSGCLITSHGYWGQKH